MNLETAPKSTTASAQRRAANYLFPAEFVGKIKSSATDNSATLELAILLTNKPDLLCSTGHQSPRPLFAEDLGLLLR